MMKRRNNLKSNNHSQLMTEKQRRQIDKRISRFGIEAVQKYAERFFDKVDIHCLTKQQAQKIMYAF